MITNNLDKAVMPIWDQGKCLAHTGFFRREALLVKCMHVLDSCETLEHMESAKRYVALAAPLLSDQQAEWISRYVSVFIDLAKLK